MFFLINWWYWGGGCILEVSTSWPTYLGIPGMLVLISEGPTIVLCLSCRSFGSLFSYVLVLCTRPLCVICGCFRRLEPLWGLFVTFFLLVNDLHLLFARFYSRRVRRERMTLVYVPVTAWSWAVVLLEIILWFYN